MIEFGEEQGMKDVDFLQILSRQRDERTERAREKAREGKLQDVLWRAEKET